MSWWCQKSAIDAFKSTSKRLIQKKKQKLLAISLLTTSLIKLQRNHCKINQRLPYNGNIKKRFIPPENFKFWNFGITEDNNSLW